MKKNCAPGFCSSSSQADEQQGEEKEGGSECQAHRAIGALVDLAVGERSRRRGGAGGVVRRRRSRRDFSSVGLQLAVSFSGAGSVLAIGGEDGHLRVFKWPTMESIFEEPDSKTSVKDLSFSSDEKFLAVNRSGGPSRVWDLESAEAVANLPREAGEIFGFCRFSHKPDNSQILFVTAMQDDHGKIITWNTTSWTRIGSKKITREAISAFAVSPDGTLLAFGTIEGSISVLGSRDMRVLVKVKKAHLGIVTTLAFSEDSRTLLSTSFDSTARVTSTGPPKSAGVSLWSMILAIILAILVYYYMQHKEDLLAMLPQ